MKVHVQIMLKDTVADPQGIVLRHALTSLGYSQVQDVRVGKYITLELKDNSKEILKDQVEQMCKKLLANPVIEEYRFSFQEE